MSRREETVAELPAAGRYMMDNGLAWGNAGNISARLDDGSFLDHRDGDVSGRARRGGLRRVLPRVRERGSCVRCGLRGRRRQRNGCRRGIRLGLELGKKPSKEVPMHAAIYEERPDIGAVLHASPFYGTLFACASETIPSGLFVETMYYLERIERVGYHHPGSAALGEAVREKAKSANVLSSLDNHGVADDVSIKEARMALERWKWPAG